MNDLQPGDVVKIGGTSPAFRGAKMTVTKVAAWGATGVVTYYVRGQQKRDRFRAKSEWIEGKVVRIVNGEAVIEGGKLN